MNKQYSSFSSSDSIKNIIFDFGGVLMDWNQRYFFRDYFNDDEKMDQYQNLGTRQKFGII